MRTAEPVAAEGPRSLTRVIEDALGLLVQDASEYAFIGFVGAAGALFAGVALRLVHNPIADAMIVPAVFTTALLTMAAATVAFTQASENLHPEAGASMTVALTRASSFIRPWLMLIAMLFAAGLALGLFARYAGSWGSAGLALALVAWPALYSLPRSHYFAVMLTQQMPERDAESVSSALFWRAPGPVVSGWAVVLTPAFAVALIGTATGLGAVSIGVAAFVFVASMPLAATIMGMLFFDAAEQAKRGGGATPRPSPRPAPALPKSMPIASRSDASRRSR